MITTYIASFNSDDIEIDLNTIYRYMGSSTQVTSAQLAQRTYDCLERFKVVTDYKVCSAVLPIRISNNTVDFAAFKADSANLAKCLCGCDRAIVFAATVGLMADMQRKKSALINSADGAILDAIGTAAVESLCKLMCSKWKKEFAPHILRPRFSPGYGDLSITLQRPLLDFLKASKNIGIVLSDSFLMIPQKSVTAIIGIGESGCTCDVFDCDTCKKSDCKFRL